jgi:uncharacterized membrane protein
MIEAGVAVLRNYSPDDSLRQCVQAILEASLAAAPSPRKA